MCYGKFFLEVKIKLINGSKVLSFVGHYGILFPWLPCMALCGLVWPYAAVCGINVLLWPRMVLLIFTAMAKCGLARLSMTLWNLLVVCFYIYFYGLFVVLYHILWSFMAEYRLFSRSQIGDNVISGQDTRVKIEPSSYQSGPMAADFASMTVVNFESLQFH